VRVGALLSAKVELTATVLEMAKPGSALETLLLRKEVLAEAARLSTARLSELASGMALEASLAVEEQNGKRVIGLEEELAAAPEFSQPQAPAVAAPLALSPSDVDPMAAMLPALGASAAGLFSSEEIGRLKLTILTGVDPRAKVEALRKLVFAPVPQNDKGLLFLRAVSDDSAEVRAEAAAGLRSMGLDAGTAAAVKALSDGSATERAAAINALARRGSDAGDAERAVVIATLAADLRGQQDPALAEKTLQSLGSIAGQLVRNPDFAAAVFRIAIKRLYAGPPPVADAAVDFLVALGAADPGLAAKLAWAEYESAPDRKAKSQLLQALARTPQAAGAERLARAGAELISGWSDSDFDCHRAASAMSRLGEAAVTALLEAVPAAPQEQKPFMIRLCDQICDRAETPEVAAEQFARALVELLKTARKPVRMAALESRSVRRATPATRASLSREVITAAHDYKLEEIVHLSEAMLRRLGSAAVSEAGRSLKSSPYKVEREIACRALDTILVDDPSLSKEAGDLLRVMLDLMKDGRFPNDALLASTLGRVAALSGAPAPAVRGTAVELKTLIKERPGRFDLLDAYSWAASSRHVDGEQKMSAGLMLLGLLDSRMPEKFVKEDWTHDGLQLTIDRSSSAHTVLIPILVAGLARIALSGAGTDGFLEKITQGLLAQWRKVTVMEVVWSPGNVAELAAGLGRIACRRETPLYLRLDVIDALRARIVHTPVARALGEALALEESSKRMDGLSAAVATEVAELAVHRDFQEPEDRGALLSALGRIALRKNVSGELTKGEELRRKIVELLFDGLRDGIAGTREALAKIAGGAHVPKALKTQVEQRLGRS
jgi:hypothetical protein